MTDEDLIRWVAQAQVGDAVPEDMSHGEVFDRLYANGAPLERGAPTSRVASMATAWAKDWVAQHPE